MRMTDVKILWARSGNRCAFPECRTEMAPSGSQTTLGEIAHIVARSTNGPRGESDLLEDNRDDYDNLILLCPTHHKMIDDNTEKWSIDSIRNMKISHEKWVAQQLSSSSIAVREFDFDSFLSKHIKRQLDYFSDKWWIYASLTPLTYSEDALNPKNNTIVSSINNCKFPPAYSVNPTVNIHLTRPNEFGLGNEDLRNVSKGEGHRICVHRSGHADFSICLQFISSHIKEVYLDFLYPNKEYNLVHYSNIAECLERQVDFLVRLWSTGLPFYNMAFTVLLTPTKCTKLVFNERVSDKLMSSPDITSEYIMITKIVDRTYSYDDLLHISLQRIVECYGWDLPNLRDADGVLSVPKLFM